ncbi:hypothetical protein Kpol_467p14 [Vanderwaltozyma polyspora DSM 70294]|uniref:Protein KTI12 n=1 Tax=Vanderwaltozyma polyspora (strain ATCC 22028 / DSM 70294 / BCRC 21397 / CBS 2163 / NBRC 10782 / NRRL Y-8283 / UCD 57-17) TaxID=436907 RepID=A7TQF8_VANPO|nr:uncharacterized protein Kpol_467p14 [Vanderwaltozyma polyspora DSM 70294]EDO15502.1 hypothetical protein Kpol_467p14 [Vanderwaltozyma polyspora DSM 70294]
MPLILFTGYPSSGKTTKAKELISLLEDKIENTPALKNKKYSIVYHSDESLGIQHNDYITSQDERKLRSEIISAVKRDLSKNNIVIVDSLNYIKGFRYQLHCEVKNCSTTFCLIHVMCPVDVIYDWNKSSSNSWDNELLDQLIQRYEEPNAQSRWDSPLFPVLSNEDSMKDYIEDISSAIFNTGNSLNTRDPLSRSFQKPNSVTILKPASQTNFIQVLDREATLVVKKIMEEIKIAQSIGNNSTSRVIVSEGVTDINDDRCSYVDLPVNGVTLAQLQRLKRQFVNLNKLRDMERDRIVHMFADYLNKNLND